MDAAHHRRQVRHEGQADRLAGDGRQSLADFRQVAVAGDTIGLEAVGGFGKQGVHLGLATGSGHAALAVGDQAGRVNDFGFDQGQEAQLHRSRIAAGVGHHAGRADGVAVDFRQAVHRLGHQLRRGMGHAVPFFPFGDVLDAEIRRKVDDPHAGFDQTHGFLHGDAVGGGEEHHVAAGEVCFVRRSECQINPAAQARIHGIDAQPGFLARSDGRELDIRMTAQKTQQFHTGVAGAADDTHLDHAFILVMRG